MPPRETDEAHDVLAAEEFAVPAADPALHERAEPAHDILAADEYGMPASDPVLHERAEPAHDILAADEYGMPAPDPQLHRHGPIRLPDEPFTDGRPHDVLAAEEFPMPAGRPQSAAALTGPPGGTGRLVAEIALGLLALVVLRRRRG